MSDKCLDVCASKETVSFSIKFIGILDDYNYRRLQKNEEITSNKVLAIALIFALVLPACILIALAFAIAVIAEILTSKTKGDV